MYTYTTRGETKSPKKHTGLPNENRHWEAASKETTFQTQKQQNVKETKKNPETERPQAETEKEYTQNPEEKRDENGEKRKEETLKVPILRISYTYVSLFSHLYIAWFHLATLVRYPPWRIENFAHFVYVLSGMYHIFTLLSYFFIPAFHRIIIAHGTWLVNAALWYPIFLTTRWPNAVVKLCNDFRQHGRNWKGDHSSMISDGAAIPYCGFVTDLGTFQALFVPLISWFVYLLFLRRRSVSLIIWEQESRYVALRARWKHILTEDEMYEKELVGIPEEGVVYVPGRGIGVGWIYRLAHLLSPALLLAGWKWWLTGEDSPPGFISPAADMLTYPGLLSIISVSVWANVGLWIWVSLNGFQYRGMVWKRDLKEGAALWVNSNGIVVGGWVR